MRFILSRVELSFKKASNILTLGFDRLLGIYFSEKTTLGFVTQTNGRTREALRVCFYKQYDYGYSIVKQ